MTINKLIYILGVFLVFTSCGTDLEESDATPKVPTGDTISKLNPSTVDTQKVVLGSYRDRLLDSLKSTNIILENNKVIKRENKDVFEDGFTAFYSKQIKYEIQKINTIELFYLKFKTPAKSDEKHLTEAGGQTSYMNDCIVKLVEFKLETEANSFFTENQKYLNPKQWPLQISLLKGKYVVMISSKNDQITDEVTLIKKIADNL